MLPKGLLKEYSGFISMMVRFMDIFLICVTGWFSYYLRFGEAIPTPSYLLAIFCGFLITPVVFSFFNIYSSQRTHGFFKHIFTLTQAVFILVLLMAGSSFFTKSGDTFSRTWFSLWMILALFGFILVRCNLLLFLRFMRSRGWNERQVVILGADHLGMQFANAVQQALWTGFRIVSFMDDHIENKPQHIHGIPLIKTPAQLGNHLVENNIDEIWLALPLRAEKRVKEILFDLRHHTINTRFVLDIFGLDLLNHSIDELAGFPVLNIRSTPMMGMNRIIKALEDRIVAAIILLCISPIFLTIALLVKLTSKGPVFFKQHRHGWDGRIIKVYKFRTMLMHQESEGMVTQATVNDARITKIGKWLRRTSLDELPQFFNVLQGRMSIVGPRPHAVSHNEIYKDAIHTYMQRHRVKPGITGWAQINGWRGETNTLEKMQKRVEYDLFYINNWSLAFDLKIILLTLFRGFIHRNAY